MNSEHKNKIKENTLLTFEKIVNSFCPKINNNVGFWGLGFF